MAEKVALSPHLDIMTMVNGYAQTAAAASPPLLWYLPLDGP